MYGYGASLRIYFSLPSKHYGMIRDASGCYIITITDKVILVNGMAKATIRVAIALYIRCDVIQSKAG